MLKIGIDLGGTKIEGIVLDETGREIFRKRIATESEYGYNHILRRIQKLYQELSNCINHVEHTLGIGTPGSISTRTGLLKNSNTVCLNGKPLKYDLEKKLGRKIVIQNDANCFAMAEALYGAGCNKEMVFGVIMGTGCGGGIVYKGQVWNGLQGISGEWGHTVMDLNGPLCYCGARGCIETFISGGGLQNRYFERYKQQLSLPEIVEQYRQGDRNSTEFMSDFFKKFGRAMANLINILDPDIVVLGGGVSNIDELYTKGVQEVAKCIFNDVLETPIVKNKLGDSAGVIGAALIGC